MVSKGPLLRKYLQPQNLFGVLVEHSSQIPLHAPHPQALLSQHWPACPRTPQAPAEQPPSCFCSALAARSKACVWGV